MSTPAIMMARQHPTLLLLALPNKLAIEIIGHLATTSKQPMDDLRSLWVTCSSMRRICGNPTIGQRVAMH